MFFPEYNWFVWGNFLDILWRKHHTSLSSRTDVIDSAINNFNMYLISYMIICLKLLLNYKKVQIYVNFEKSDYKILSAVELKFLNFFFFSPSIYKLNESHGFRNYMFYSVSGKVCSSYFRWFFPMSHQNNAFALDQFMNIFLECSYSDIFLDDLTTLLRCLEWLVNPITYCSQNG